MEKEIVTATDSPQHLDEANEMLRASVKKKWNKAIFFACVAFFILLVIGIVGLAYQNHYALQNKNHIDCIIKDLSTPPPQGSSPNVKKYIDIRSTLSADCNIKFTE